jgi:pimeloyl-ACP methyl ester carboxylesterase
MASFSLVHGAWYTGSVWDGVRAELAGRGHVVHAPDLPCEDTASGVDQYVEVIPAADVVVGHSLGGLTIPYVRAETYVFLAALVAGTGVVGAFAKGFRGPQAWDEAGSSWYTDAEEAARQFQYPPGSLPALRRQAPYHPEPRTPEGRVVYIVCAEDGVVRADWQRHLAEDVLHAELIERPWGHSPMVTHPRELAELLDSIM